MSEQEQCPECHGLGWEEKLDIMTAKRVRSGCPACHGTGMKQIAPEEFQGEGLRVATVHCQVLFFQYYIDHKVVATLELRVMPCLDKDGKPKIVGKIPILYAEIPRMHTRSKHRKKGYMTKCLNAARMDPKVSRLETSWDDSPEIGRNFLISRGFRRDGDILLWRQGMDKEAR